MPEKAQVTSLEALESFRTTLVIYLANALRVLDEVSGEVRRTRMWLEDDRFVHWENEVRRRTRKLEEKQSELFSAKMSSLQEATQSEHMAVQKAKRALDEAQSKLDVIKKWNRHYDNRVQPLAREVDKLRDVLSVHMGKGVAYLTQATRTLGEYAELTPAGTHDTVGTASTEPESAAPAAPTEEHKS